MSTTLIDQDEFNGEVLLNTFYGGEGVGVCSQLTIISYGEVSLTQMKLDDMINFFETGLKRLNDKLKELGQ